MLANRLGARSPLVVMSVGAVLFLSAALQHLQEILALKRVFVPVIAFLLDGILALALVYAGHRLSRTDLSPQGRWTVLVWSLSGTLLLVGVMGATFLVLIFEGRTVAEPVFPLLVAAEAGGLAGLVAGYYKVSAEEDARRSRTVSNALAFINDLIRHDLRNDLNVIQGHAEPLAAADDDTDGQNDGGDAATIAGKADEALSRIETSRVIADTLVGDPDLEPIDLAAVIGEIAARVDDTFAVTVETDLPDSAVVTANDGIRSVVDNLLENAVEHNDADDPWVATSVRVAADTVVFTVTDNGPGIPEDVRQSIFEPSEAGSSGGLSLVYTLVTGYGGEVRIEDAEQGGARVVVTLPRDDA
jgi:signal transduction histidine kinase